MKILLILIGSVFTVLVTWLIPHLIRYLESRSQSIDQDIKKISQEQVFDWALKVVQTIEEEYRNSDLEKKIKSQRKFDQAIGRLNDILMLNSIDPRQYNSDGIITYSVHKLHKQEVKNNGESNRSVS